MHIEIYDDLWLIHVLYGLSWTVMVTWKQFLQLQLPFFQPEFTIWAVTLKPWLITNLVGGLEHFLFFHIFGIIIPTDFHIFQRVETTNQKTIANMIIHY